MHSGEKGRLDLFTTMGVNSGLHEWTANGACLFLITGLGGEEALGDREGGRRRPSVQADEVLLVWFVIIHELFAIVIAGPKSRTSLA